MLWANSLPSEPAGVPYLKVTWQLCGPKEKGTTEDEMVGWHHQLDGHEFEQTLGVGDGQGSLAWGSKELDMGLQRVGHD